MTRRPKSHRLVFALIVFVAAAVLVDSKPPPQPVPLPQQIAEDQKTIIISRLNEVRETGWRNQRAQSMASPPPRGAAVSP